MSAAGSAVRVARTGRVGPGLLALAASAGLAAAAAHGAWPLVFVMLLPWIALQGRLRGDRAALVWAAGMAVAFCLAVLPWFGQAIGRFTHWGEPAGLAVLVLLAPLLQPQFLAWAWLRRRLDPARRPLLAPLGAALVWVALEWVWPKPLGDTLGHGLYPAPLLRLVAEVGGTAGLTLGVLLVHEALAAAWARRAAGLRGLAAPLGAALGLPLLAALYGLWAQQPEATAGGATVPTLRMGLVQSNLTDYEALRREKGAAAVVREVLDLHVAMSYDAVERQRVQAVLWSETVYPTTFGRPKSEAGADFDREITEIVNAAGVPFVLGTYDRDDAGEYNSAAFVQPGSGLLGHYRKVRPFPFSETVPAWLDGPLLRQWLPWTGGWRAGDGVRVFPLRVREGAGVREVPVLPLICRDAVDPQLAIAGARLGAQVILSLSNDSWFGEGELGARLHLAVAAFRSIETRLPQFRVTSSGISAVIDRDGTLLAATRRGERTLVVGELPLREPRRTLVVAWGNWVGLAATLVLAAAGLLAVARRLAGRALGAGDEPARRAPSWADGAPVTVMPMAARWAVVALRSAAAGLLVLCALAAALGHPLWPANTLAQLRLLGIGAGLPALAAACLAWAWRARVSLQGQELVFARGTRQLRVPLGDISGLRPWRVPVPHEGLTLVRRSGAPLAVAGADAAIWADRLARPLTARPPWAERWARSRAAALALAAHRAHRVLRHPLTRFALLPALLAVPAFRLHQHIAFGSSFGEWQAYGPGAFLLGFGLWWAGWALGALLVAAALRVVIEAVVLGLAVADVPHAQAWRGPLEWTGHLLLYAGMPAWLAWRALGW